MSPVDRAPRSPDHPDRPAKPGSLAGRPCYHAHGKGIVGWQRQDQQSGLVGTEPSPTAQRVILAVGARIIVDANEQVDRLGRRIVEGYHDRFFAGPIDRLSGRSYYQLGPI